jgi:uncharacterized delta-60 repeat protein
MKKLNLISMMLLMIVASSFAQVGNIDATFNTYLPFGTVKAIFAQNDGSVLVGGDFGSNTLAKLNSDGSTNTSFTPKGYGVIYSFDTLEDGRIILAGNLGMFCISLNGDSTYFSKYPGSCAKVVNNKILVACGTTMIRLLDNGDEDSTFNTITFSKTGVWSIVITSDNKILVGGNMGVFKYNEDGTPDDAFNANSSNLFVSSTSVDKRIRGVVIQSTGRIVIGGIFTLNSLGYVTNMARLNSDGTLDNTFNNIFNGEILHISMQNDDKVIAGGYFTSPKSKICRIGVNGAIDNSFVVGSACTSLESVFATEIQPDGNALIGGNFTTYNGNSANKICRLLGDNYLRASICYVTVDTATAKSKIIWQKEDGLGIDHYVIYKQVTNVQYDSIASVDFDSDNYFIDNSSEPEAYVQNYKVRAVNTIGTASDYSSSFGTVKARNLAAANGDVEIDWNVPEGIENVPQFTIYAVTGGGLTAINNVPGTVTQYTVISPTASKYVVGIDGMDDCSVGKGSKSSTTILSNFVAPKVVETSINDINNEKVGNFNVYPNPNNGVFNINFNNPELKINKVEVVNNIGQTVYSEIIYDNSYNKSVDLSSFSKGIYLINIKTDNKLYSNKIIVK